jgi:nucleoside-diphosphate-sugar epimerase
MGANKRVLVTGATGCIGRQALPALVARGWDVHAVAGRRVPTDPGGVTWHRADLLDPNQAHDVVRRASPSHLLHLAWSIAPGQWARAPENFDWLAASVGLMRAFRAAGGTRMVTAGSCLEYDWDYGYCAEARTPCTPHTVYGTCKHALQLVAARLAEQSGMTSAWGRIFFLYGPYEHPDRLVAAVTRALLAGEPALCSHGRQVRDYLFSTDVAEAFVALLESDVTGPINIASGVAVTLRDIVGRIGDLLGRRDLVRFGAIPAAATDKPLVVADTTRLMQSLAWRPRYDLDAGLMETIDWWRAQMKTRVAVGGRP